MANGNAGRVLLVEDDESNREALSDFLRDEGYEVVPTAHGAEAMDYLRSGPLPDVILLDVMMPVMNAWEFCAEQKRHPVLATIPVILLSAGYRVEEEARAMGVAAVLRKPPDLERLLEHLALRCRRSTDPDA